MENISTYLKKYGKYTFLEEEFNEIDNVIFSLIAYIDFFDIVPPIGKKSILLGEASKLFYKKYTKKEINSNVTSVRNSSIFLKEIAKTKRYKDLKLYNYHYEVNLNTQFGAICIGLPDKSVYVAFEGTDGYISGWEEDFMLVYMFPINSQKLAIKYLNKVVGLFDKKVYVGGHSKGGNLALVASMYAKPLIRYKIKKVFCNDAPGLREQEFMSKEYKKVNKKLVSLVPNESVVAMLLRHNDYHTVIKSSGRKFIQHDAFRWVVEDKQFKRAKLSDFSRRINNSILIWLDKLDIQKREEFVVALFDTLKKAEISDLKEFKKTKINSIYRVLKETKQLDKETKKMLMDCFKDFMGEMSKGVVDKNEKR